MQTQTLRELRRPSMAFSAVLLLPLILSTFAMPSDTTEQNSECTLAHRAL